MNKFFSFSLGFVLFSGPLMTIFANFLGIDTYLQIYVLLTWLIIFIIKNNINIYSNIVELITANKLFSLLLVTMYIGMALQINPYLFFETFVNLFSRKFDLDLNLDRGLIRANIYYFDLAVRFIAISLMFLLAVQDISNLRNFFIGMALVTILTAIVTLGINWDKFIHMCTNKGFVGFQLTNMVNRADLSYKLALAFSVLYIYAIRRSGFNAYFLIFFIIASFMMFLSGGKGGMFVYAILMLFIAFKKNEVKLILISSTTFSLTLVLLAFMNICNTSVFIDQNLSRLTLGVYARVVLVQTQLFNIPENPIQKSLNQAQDQIQESLNKPEDQIKKSLNKPEDQIQKSLNKPEDQIQKSLNKPEDQIQINKSNNAIDYSVNKYKGTLFTSDLKHARSGSGTHNFFIDLYKNFSIYSFLMILVPLFMIISIASLRCYKDKSKVYFDTKLIFIAVLAVTFFSFTFSSYLSRNILFPLVVSVSYLIASIKTTKQSNHDHE